MKRFGPQGRKNSHCPDAPGTGAKIIEFPKTGLAEGRLHWDMEGSGIGAAMQPECVGGASEFPPERTSPASSLSPSRGGTGVPWWYDAQAMMRLYWAAYRDAFTPHREEKRRDTSRR